MLHLPLISQELSPVGFGTLAFKARLPGFVGPVPPPALDKVVGIKTIKSDKTCQVFFKNRSYYNKSTLYLKDGMQL